MYYNQKDYAHIPYPAPGYESATVKTGGCGPTAMAMLIEDLLGITFPPHLMAEYAMAHGARVSGGTDMQKLCRALAKEHGLTFTTTNQAADVLIALERGARVIANVGGNRPGYTGLFSDGGHFIYLRQKDGTTVTVWDPGYYSGKYNKAGRKGRVTVKGNDILAEMVEIDKDCQNRSPRYYILEDAMTQEQFDTMMDNYMSRKAALPVDPRKAPAEYQAAIKAGITDGTRPQDFVTRQEAAVMANRALE